MNTLVSTHDTNQPHTLHPLRRLWTDLNIYIYVYITPLSRASHIRACGLRCIHHIRDAQHIFHATASKQNRPTRNTACDTYIRCLFVSSMQSDATMWKRIASLQRRRVYSYSGPPRECWRSATVTCTSIAPVGLTRILPSCRIREPLRAMPSARCVWPFDRACQASCSGWATKIRICLSNAWLLCYILFTFQHVAHACVNIVNCVLNDMHAVYGVHIVLWSLFCSLGARKFRCAEAVNLRWFGLFWVFVRISRFECRWGSKCCWLIVDLR